ncbi:MAG: hypothetical protein COY53_08830 [Elusimicrobia bacterium CG_4_10_14_0_8_um_filter_37_32]|nr:MAG: hypothetical protein COY53_08830 [Elusimicrobia bacterium CG_4_10_14_0_8_um_filter_37_32]
MKGLIRKAVEVDTPIVLLGKTDMGVNSPPKADNLGGNLIMKKLAGLVLGLFLVVGITGMAVAYNPDVNSEVRVRCSISDVQLSVSVLAAGTTTTVWTVAGGLPVSSSTVISSSVTVINDSGGLTESYMLSATNATKVGGGGVDWTLADTPGADTFSIRARFNGNTVPNDDDTDFTSSLHNLTTTPTYSGALAEQFAGIETGKDVLYTAPNRGLWLRILTPTSIKDASEHETIVTITAATPQ